MSQPVGNKSSLKGAWSVSRDALSVLWWRSAQSRIRGRWTGRLTYIVRRRLHLGSAIELRWSWWVSSENKQSLGCGVCRRPFLAENRFRFENGLATIYNNNHNRPVLFLIFLNFIILYAYIRFGRPPRTVEVQFARSKTIIVEGNYLGWPSTSALVVHPRGNYGNYYCQPNQNEQSLYKSTTAVAATKHFVWHCCWLE